MDIEFRNKKLKKVLGMAQGQAAKLGEKRARVLKIRLNLLESAETLADLWPPYSGPSRCQELTEGQRREQHQLSVDVDHPYRLLFVPDHDPMPMRPEGGLDWGRVTAIKIIAIENTHKS